MPHRTSLLLLMLPALLAEAAPPARHRIEIRSFVFGTGADTVNVGDTVEWINHDIVPHTATGPGFDSGSIDPSGSRRVVMRRPGTFEYHCRFHPAMRARLVVRRPARSHATPTSNSR